MNMSAELLKALQECKEDDDASIATVLSIMHAEGSMESIAKINDFSFTPLGVALSQGNKKLALILLQNGANVLAPGVFEALRAHQELLGMVNAFTEYRQLKEIQSPDQSQLTQMGKLEVQIGTFFSQINLIKEFLEWNQRAAGRDNPFGMWNVAINIQDISTAVMLHKKAYFLFDKVNDRNNDRNDVENKLRAIVCRPPSAHNPAESAAIYDANEFLLQIDAPKRALPKLLGYMNSLIILDEKRANTVLDNEIMQTVKNAIWSVIRKKDRNDAQYEEDDLPYSTALCKFVNEEWKKKPTTWVEIKTVIDRIHDEDCYSIINNFRDEKLRHINEPTTKSFPALVDEVMPWFNVKSELAELQKKAYLFGQQATRAYDFQCSINFHCFLISYLNRRDSFLHNKDQECINEFNLVFRGYLLLCNMSCVHMISVREHSLVFLTHTFKDILNQSNRDLQQKVLDTIAWRKSKDNPKEIAVIQKLAEKQHIFSIQTLAELNAKHTNLIGKPNRISEALSLYLQLFILLSSDVLEKISDKYVIPVQDIKPMCDKALSFIASIMRGRSEYAEFAGEMFKFATQLQVKPVHAEKQAAAAAAAADVSEINVNAIICRGAPKIWERYKASIQKAMGVGLPDEYKAEAGPVVSAGGGADVRPVQASAPPLEGSTREHDAVVLAAAGGETNSGEPAVNQYQAEGQPNPNRAVAPASSAERGELAPAAVVDNRGASAGAAQVGFFALRDLSDAEKKQRADESAALAVQGMELPKASQEEGAGEKGKEAKKDLQMTVVVGAPGGPK